VLLNAVCLESDSRGDLLSKLLFGDFERTSLASPFLTGNSPKCGKALIDNNNMGRDCDEMLLDGTYFVGLQKLPTEVSLPISCGLVFQYAIKKV